MTQTPAEFSDLDIPTKTEQDASRETLLVDGHVDLPYYMRAQARETLLSELHDGPFTLEKAKQARIGIFCTALYCEDKFDGEASFSHFQEILRFTLDHFDRITLIRTKGDIESVAQDPRRMGTLFLLENADALAQDPSYIGRLKENGIAIVGLTHAGKNRLADGNGVSYSSGLTHKGLEVVHALEDCGVLIDVAHLHPECFWELLDVFRGTLLTSHTGVRNICEMPRNIDLDQAKEIVERKGMIGVTFNPEMLSPAQKADVEQVFIHFDCLVQEFGPDCIGVGSDFCGFDLVTEGLEDITGLSRLSDLMLAHGYGESAVHRIMGLNWLRLYKTLY